MSLSIDMRPALRAYLDDVTALGLHGSTPERVVESLVEQALRDIVAQGLVPARRFAPDSSDVQPDPAPPHDDVTTRDENPPVIPDRVVARTDANGGYVYAADRVLEAIRQQGPEVTNARLAEVASVSLATVSMHLAELDRQGRIERQNFGKNRTITIIGEPSTSPATGPQAGRTAKPANGDRPPRRFEEPSKLDPQKVHGLAPDHPAVVEGRSLFPTTVVAATDSPQLFVSGANQRKIGDRVTKGPWAGMPIYSLTLEERATCSRACHHRGTCYGNGMPQARRHRHGPKMEERLAAEIAALAHLHPDGFVTHVHVLGDFYSTEYVRVWEQQLEAHPALHVFGYTFWADDTEIGAAIQLLRGRFPDRFAIRVSRPDVTAPDHREMAATTIWRIAEGRQAEGIVCPAQTHPGVCCGSCGLCWHPEMRDTPIAFIAHGRRTRNGHARGPEEAESRAAPAARQSDTDTPDPDSGPAGPGPETTRKDQTAQPSKSEIVHRLVKAGTHTARQIVEEAGCTRAFVYQVSGKLGVKLPSPAPNAGRSRPRSSAPAPRRESQTAKPPKDQQNEGETTTRTPPAPEPRPIALAPKAPADKPTPDRVDEQRQIDDWLRRNGGARTYEPGTLQSLLEQTFAAVDRTIAFRAGPAFARKPYLIDGTQSVDQATAIFVANQIREQLRLTPLVGPEAVGASR